MKDIEYDMRTLTRRTRLTAAVSAALTGLLLLSACSGGSEEPTEEEAATEQTAEATWPRTFENADGTTTEIPEQPERVLSTAVSVTGTLLAIEAPLVASGSQQGAAWFEQWAEVAEEREVENIWSVGEVDLEAVYAQDPDLIVVATSGRDALVDNVAEFQEIAPTIIVDYGGQTWQDLALELGEATGLEDSAQQVIDDFDARVAEVAGSITLPEGEANIISFNGAGQENPIGRAGGAQGKLLAELGFTIEDPNVEWHTQAQEREDFVWASYEKLTELTAGTTFVLSQDNEGAQVFTNDPVFANVPSVKAGQVYGLGLNSFRMDPYSALEIVESVAENFAN